MDWESLLKIKIWTPLQSIGQGISFVDNGLYQINQNTYILTKPYNHEGLRGLPEAPFITRAFWAVSLEAAKRLVFHDPSINITSDKVTPPECLLLESNGTYKSLIKIAKDKYKNSYTEQATYSGNPDALFIHKEISIDRFEFCFFEREIFANERPYGIAVKLLK